LSPVPPPSFQWDESSPYYKIVTKSTTLSKEDQDLVSDHSKRLFTRLGINDYARMDWRMDGKGQLRLLEANPNCGWCWDGHLPKTAALAGIDYANFFKIILESAWARYEKIEMEKVKVKKFVNVGKSTKLNETCNGSSGNLREER